MLQFVPQRRQMLLDDRVERRILRLMALVAVDRADRVLAVMRLHSGVLNEPALCSRSRLPARSCDFAGKLGTRMRRCSLAWRRAEKPAGTVEAGGSGLSTCR